MNLKLNHRGNIASIPFVNRCCIPFHKTFKMEVKLISISIPKFDIWWQFGSWMFLIQDFQCCRVVSFLNNKNAASTNGNNQQQTTKTLKLADRGISVISGNWYDYLRSPDILISISDYLEHGNNQVLLPLSITVLRIKIISVYVKTTWNKEGDRLIIKCPILENLTQMPFNVIKHFKYPRYRLRKVKHV